MQEFYQSVEWLNDGFHFIVPYDSTSKPIHSARNLNAWGFKENRKLSRNLNLPVYFYTYCDEYGRPLFRKGISPSSLSHLKRNERPRINNRLCIVKKSLSSDISLNATTSTFSITEIIDAPLYVHKNYIEILNNALPKITRAFYEYGQISFAHIRTEKNLAPLLELILGPEKARFWKDFDGYSTFGQWILPPKNILLNLRIYLFNKHHSEECSWIDPQCFLPPAINNWH